MSQSQTHENFGWMQPAAFALAFVLVLMGMANNLPNIPGLLDAIRSIPGLAELPRISKYNSEFFFPLTFALMMVIALMTSSFAKDWQNESRAKFALGILLDVLLLVMVLSMAVVYLIENEQVC